MLVLLLLQHLYCYSKHVLTNSYCSAGLTEGHDDGAGDAVGHHHCEDVHHPGIRCSELKLVGLML